MKKLEYKIRINAPKEKVWDTMLQPETYQQWVAASWPDSFYEGEWKEGGEIRFVSKDGSGTLACVTELRPHQFIAAEHIALLQKGGEADTESQMAKGWIGITESYSFEEVGDATELTVTIHANPEWQKMFDDGWPAALEKLKEIAE